MAPNTRNTIPEEFAPAGKNRTQLDEYIDTKLTEYREGSDGFLWAIFTQDFKDWTLEQLKTASALRLMKLTILLKSYGVYVDETNAHLVAANIQAAAAEENPHQWTEEEVIAHL
jgi:hypothetical protein